jgi:carboxymethylenebutenolidase
MWHALSMCHAADADPPDLPSDLRRVPPFAGGAVHGHDLQLTSADGTPFAAFAARAATPSGAGIVVFPDIRGLFHFYEELAMRFAEAGHDAIAFDYYARTAGPWKRDAAFDYLAHVGRTTPEGVAADAAAAGAYLRSPAGGGVHSLFTLGFCFGGRNSYLQAASGSPVRPDGVVAFYGQLGSDRAGRPGPLARAADMGGPILGLFGGADETIPRDSIDAFDTALTAAGAEHEFHVYEGAPHSFFDRGALDYAAQAEDAWRRVLAFIGTHTRAG